MARLQVVGLGNVLMGDDGFGPHVLRVLEAEWEAPPDVRLLDAGTPGAELASLLDGSAALIVIDTVRADGPPGELRLYRRDDILRHAPGQRIGPHDPGLKETLLLLELEGVPPAEVLLVGVIPERTTGGPGLGDAVRPAVPRAVAAVVDELRRLGYPLRHRDPPRRPEIWWEADD